MRSYYDTLIDHLGTSNFSTLRHAVHEDFMLALRRSFHELSIPFSGLLLQEELRKMEKQIGAKPFVAYQELLLLMEQEMEVELAEILGPFFQDWMRFKNYQKAKPGVFNLEKCFEFWVNRQSCLSNNLASYYRDWANKRKKQSSLEAILQYNKWNGKEKASAFHGLSQDQWMHTTILNYQFNSDAIGAKSIQPNQGSSKGFFEFDETGNESLNLKAKSGRIRLDLRFEELSAIPLQLDPSIDLDIALATLQQEKQSLDKLITQLGNVQVNELQLLNNKHLFAAQKIELKLHIEGDFSAEDQIKIRNQKPSFFPLYLSLSQEDEFEVSMKQDGMLIHWVKTDKKPFLVYHGDLRQAGQT